MTGSSSIPRHISGSAVTEGSRLATSASKSTGSGTAVTGTAVTGTAVTGAAVTGTAVTGATRSGAVRSTATTGVSDATLNTRDFFVTETGI